MENLKDSISVTVKGNTYQVKYPTVGQFLNIRSLINELTFGQYGNLIASRSTKDLQAARIAEIQAHVTVLFPKEFWQDLNVKSLSDLSISDFTELSAAYTKTVSPWLAEWEKLFNEIE